MAVLTSPLPDVALSSDLCLAEDKCSIYFTGSMIEWRSELTTEEDNGDVSVVISAKVVFFNRISRSI